MYKITYRSSIIIKGKKKIVICMIGPMKIVDKRLLERANAILVVGNIRKR